MFESGSYDRLAGRILDDHAPPDLRHIVVLLPNYHVAQPLAQRLAVLAGRPVLMPQLTTFTDWVQSVPLAQSPVPDSARLAALYQALRRQGWFEQADRWALAGELLDLMDELTREHLALPQDEDAFLAQLEQAYQARSNRALQFEARVVHELWRAMSGSGGLDAVAAYQQRLALLAAQASAPLYVLITSDLATPERRFLEAYAERAPVRVFDLRVLATGESAAQALSSSNPLTTHDYQLPTAFFLFPAQGLEHEAQAADVQIRRWLLAGKRSIAVVAQDRLVARRVRALLERAQILVQDETGWTFATLAVSAVLMRWLEAVQGDFYYQDVLDLMKSPFVYADQPAAERKQAVYQLERLLREHQVASRLEEYQRLAESEVLRHALLRLQQAAQPLPTGREFTLAGWLERLEQSLDSLGVLTGWAQDAAGRELLQLLADWREELADDRSRFSFGEWRRWLAQQLDLATFRDTSVESPVVFTHLAATRWRVFDAVLLLGCDADHLPGKAGAGQWFNDAVRGAIGLPMTAHKIRQVQDDLRGLLALNDTVLVTWQETKNGEPNLLSPWLELLRAGVADDLTERELAPLLELAHVQPEASVPPQPHHMPRPAAPAALLPPRISPSGYNTLMACPYQYYARYILRLDDLDEVREALDKRDYGAWVHKILERFHRDIPSDMPRDQRAAALARLSDEVFAEAVQHDFLAHGWRVRWQAQQAAYLDWQLENEAAGWRFAAAEQGYQLAVNDDLLLHGRLDRLDTQADGARRVLDYKTKDKASLNGLLKHPGEDVQLASYAALSLATAAAFVSLDDSKAVVGVQPEQDLPDLAGQNLARLKEIFGQLRVGQPLPANGVDKVCEYCAMKGLCRKGWWAEGGGFNV
ncbi:PD-(D/E)XK nuclease family protein [Ferriphaselus sp. R-1]|uniref:PD-(D/E)XK nuclease family protein n=1 Tax=Ferriphaselus sp. R-1 TaxID=1485544 RepID=UPI00054F069B|nr:PD-(D/E)XK nuclease family protein [Ferriphaselus sp. R-1]